jgi:hypothetical protein
MDQMVELCPNCQIRRRKRHFNSKWCAPCAEEFKRRPRHTLTPEQIREVRKRLYRMPKAQICQEVGISWSALGRWARDEGVRVAYFNRHAAHPDLVKEVCEYYAEHGMPATEKKYPHLKIRSIVERYPHVPRQIRWKPHELIELAKMGGIISPESQARYFKRPNANQGAIKSAWMKRFRQGGGQVNGLSYYVGRHFVDPSCPWIQTTFWSQRQLRKGKQTHFARRIYLWVDVEKHLRKDAPDWLRDTTQALAKFQRWLFGTSEVHATVKRMIRERAR